jgi:hypothetical protein
MDYVSVTPASIRTLLVAAISAMSGIAADRVQIETKNDARPSDGLYATLWFKGSDVLPDYSGDKLIGNESTVTETLRGESLCSVQISFWGAGAYDAAVKTQLKFLNNQREFDLWRILGSAGVESVQDLSQQFGGQVQQRAFFEFNYYVCFENLVPLDWFDTSTWTIYLQ